MHSTMLQQMLNLGYRIHRGFIDEEILERCYSSICLTLNGYLNDETTDERRVWTEEDAQARLLKISNFSLEQKIIIRKAVAKSSCTELIRDAILSNVFSENAKDRLKIFSEDIVFSLPKKAWPLRNWHQEAYADRRIRYVAHLALSLGNVHTGGLRIYNGPEINNLLPHEPFSEDGANPHHRRIIGSDVFENSHVQLELNAGDLAILGGLTPHAGGENTSELPRIFYALRLMTP